MISIHALVKRATYHPLPPRRARAISIHALVKRATAPPQTQFAQNFISIHALVKRATFRAYVYGVVFVNFNPRPREEGDPQKR